MKLQLNIDTVVSYKGISYQQTFLAFLYHQTLLRLFYSPVSGVTSVSEVTPILYLICLCVCDCVFERE